MTKDKTSTVGLNYYYEKIPCNHVKLIWDFGRQSWLCSLCSAEYKLVPAANSPNSTTQYLQPQGQAAEPAAMAMGLPGSPEHLQTLATLWATEVQAWMAAAAAADSMLQAADSMLQAADSADSMLQASDSMLQVTAIRGKCLALVEQALNSASNARKDTQR